MSVSTFAYFLRLLLLLLSPLLLVSGSNVWIVRQNPPRPDRVISVGSIDDFILSISNQSLTLESHDSVRFSPGIHTVTAASTGGTVDVHDVNNLSLLVGTPSISSGSVANIRCQTDFGLSFVNVGDLLVSGLGFENCGAPLQLVDFGFNESIDVVLHVETNDYPSQSITLDNVNITGSSGVGLLLSNIHGNLTLSNLHLNGNALNCYIQYQLSSPQDECFDNSSITVKNQTFFHEIRNSNFSSGKSCYDKAICNASASGLTIVFNQLRYRIEFHVNNVALQDNAATEGGNNLMLTTTSCCKVQLLNFTNVKSIFSTESHSITQRYGLKYTEAQCNCKSSVSRNIAISRSLFSRSCVYAELLNNLGLAAGVSYTTLGLEHTNISGSSCVSALQVHNINSVELDSVTVTESTGHFTLRAHNGLRLWNRFYQISLSGVSTFANNTGGISIKGDAFRLLRSTQLIFTENSKIVVHQNMAIDQTGEQYGAVMYTSDAILDFLEGSYVEFTHNNALLCGGIAAIRSLLRFINSSSVMFLGNVGNHGGAIALYEKSELIFYESNTTIEFVNNTARNYGGGLYVDDSSYLERISNAYTAQYFSVFGCSPSLSFYNNSAGLGGSALYGGWIDWVNYRHVVLTVHNISQFIHIESHEGDLSPIASKPTRVCWCSEGKPDCSIAASNQSVEIYHGETLNVSVVTIGQRNGTVASSVSAKFVKKADNYLRDQSFHNQYSGAELKAMEHIQLVKQHCTILGYTPLSSNSEENLKLVARNREVLRYNGKTIAELIKGDLRYKIQFIDLHIHIKFKSCPFGYYFDNSTRLCTCVSLPPSSSTYDIYCLAEQFKLFRKEFTWVGVQKTLANGNESLSTEDEIIYGLCPFDYCKVNETAIDLTTLDEQCNFQRSGVLCGGCKENLSVVFGSSLCKDCSHTLVIPTLIGFALAGIALIILLQTLNLTISVGTINCVLFYANIANDRSIVSFFPDDFKRSFLHRFISVLNMGTGTESCFYNGMSTYTRSWLLFVFPCYIWLLSSFIIAISHYSSRASKCFGRNSVQVLATLFLFTYAKVLEITITTSAFSFTTISSPNGTVRYVWLLDGNFQYMSLKHALLFAATMLLLMFVCIPYTLILISVQWLQRQSHRKILRWILKLKPFIDAHTGPYKDKHRYWTGLLLLLRAVVFFLCTLNSRKDHLINSALVAIVAISLLFYLLFVRGVYKSRLLNVIEGAFLFNLCVLSTSSFIQIIFHSQTYNLSFYIAQVSVGSAFVYVCLVLIYHIGVRVGITQVKVQKILKRIVPPVIHCAVTDRYRRYQKLSVTAVSDDESETSIADSWTRRSFKRQVTHSSIAIMEDKPLLADCSY